MAGRSYAGISIHNVMDFAREIELLQRTRAYHDAHHRHKSYFYVCPYNCNSHSVRNFVIYLYHIDICFPICDQKNVCATKLHSERNPAHAIANTIVDIHAVVCNMTAIISASDRCFASNLHGVQFIIYIYITIYAYCNIFPFASLRAHSIAKFEYFLYILFELYFELWFTAIYVICLVLNEISAHTGRSPLQIWQVADWLSTQDE